MYFMVLDQVPWNVTVHRKTEMPAQFPDCKRLAAPEMSERGLNSIRLVRLRADNKADYVLLKLALKQGADILATRRGSHAQGHTKYVIVNCS